MTFVIHVVHVVLATPMVDQHSSIGLTVMPTMQLTHSPTLALAVVLVLVATIEGTLSLEEQTRIPRLTHV